MTDSVQIVAKAIYGAWCREPDPHARWAADDYRAQATECRRFARVLLRWGDRRGHRAWMHDAVRAWRNFKYWHRRATWNA